MTDQEIIEKLTRILRDLLGEESIVLARETERQDVPNWDSFNYVTFIVSVEVEFGIKFQLTDVEAFKNVGEIVDQIKQLKS